MHIKVNLMRDAVNCAPLNMFGVNCGYVLYLHVSYVKFVIFLIYRRETYNFMFCFFNITKKMLSNNQNIKKSDGGIPNSTNLTKLHHSFIQYTIYLIIVLLSK